MTAEDRLSYERYFDGEVTPEERQQLEARLAADPAARRYLAALRRVRTLMKTYDPAAKLPPSRPVVIPTRRRLVPAAIWWSGAVAAAVLLGVSSFRLMRRPALELAPKPGATPIAGDSVAESAARLVRPSDVGLEPAVLAWANQQAPRPSDLVNALRRERMRGEAPEADELLVLEAANGGSTLVAQLGHVVGQHAGVGRIWRHHRRAGDSPNSRARSRPGRGDKS